MKFKRAFCTDTRLMGAMMLVVEWIGESGIIEAHIFLMDSEGLGLTDFYKYESSDMNYLERVYKYRTGGLGGHNVGVEMTMAAYMVKSYRDRTIRYSKPLPENLDIGLYEDIDTSSLSVEDMLDLTCKDISCDNEFINYCVMRFIARDREGLLYISDNQNVADHHITEINGTLLYNKIEKKSDDRFVWICAYEDKDGYYEAKLIVSIDKTTVRQVEGIYSDFINIEEYKSYYKLRSIMVIDKYPISEYDAFCLISKPELIKKYRILDDMKKDDISRELINMCPAIQTNDYERGILLTQYYMDNSHVEEDEYIINNDIMFNIYIDEKYLYLAAYDYDELDQVSFSMEKIFSEAIIEEKLYDFDDLILFDFIESENEDFEDFLDE